jgi:hypothetical protein
MYDKEDNGLKLSNSWAGYYILLNPDFKQQVWVGCGDGRKQGMSMASGVVGGGGEEEAHIAILECVGRSGEYTPKCSCFVPYVRLFVADGSKTKGAGTC